MTRCRRVRGPGRSLLVLPRRPGHRAGRRGPAGARSVEAAGARAAAGAEAAAGREAKAHERAPGVDHGRPQGADRAPRVDVNAGIAGGSRRASSGLASLTADMLDEGAGTRSALEIADADRLPRRRADDHGASDARHVDLHVPVARLADALPMMARRRRASDVPGGRAEAPARRAAGRRCSSRGRPGAADPVRVPPDRVRREAPVRHPVARHGRIAQGVHGRGPARRFTPRTTARRTPSLVVAGDVTADDRRAATRDARSAAGKAGPAARRRPRRRRRTRRRARSILIDKPGAAQSQIRIGWIGVPRSTPDYFALRVLNTILGEAFTSRLNTNLREVHGYTYGAARASTCG